MEIHEAVRQALKEVAEQRFGSLSAASRAAGGSKDQLRTQVRGTRALRLDRVSEYLEAWAYPKKRFVARVSALVAERRSEAVSELMNAEAFLGQIVRGVAVESPELHLALAVDDHSMSTSCYEVENVQEEARDIDALRVTSRERSLFLANRVLGTLVVDADLGSSKAERSLRIASVLSAWARVSRSFGRYLAGAVAQHKALELTERHPLSLVRGNILHRTGILIAELGFHRYGLACLNDAMRIHQLGGNQAKVAATILTRGVIEAAAGRQLEAVRSYQYVLERQQELDPIYGCSALLNLGRLYYSAREIGTSRRYLEEIDTRYRSKLKGHSLALVERLEAELAAAEGQSEKASHLYARLLPEALAHFEPHEVFLVFAQFGNLLLEHKDWPQFVRTLRELDQLFRLAPLSSLNQVAITEAIRMVRGAALPDAQMEELCRTVLARTDRLNSPGVWMHQAVGDGEASPLTVAEPLK